MAQCFLPNGTAWPIDTPCNANAAHSACCPEHSACLANGYCIGTGDAAEGDAPNVVARSSCTDATWEDPACPVYCADVYPDAGCAVFAVAVSSQPAHQYFCCDGHDQNKNASYCGQSTNGSSSPFQLKVAGIIGDRSTGSTLAFDGGGLMGRSTLIGTATATATGTTWTMASDRTGMHSTNELLAVGAGIGVPLVVLLFVACGMLWTQTLLLRKARRNLAVERRRRSCNQSPRFATKSVRLIKPELGGHQRMIVSELPAVTKSVPEKG